MQTITFEPLKLITLGITLLLLAPISVVFWRIAVHRPWPSAEHRGELESILQERAREIGTKKEDGGVVTAVAIETRELIGFSKRTYSWLSFYPRRWIGIVGLVAVVVVLGCVAVSLFVPHGEWLSIPPDV